MLDATQCLHAASRCSVLDGEKGVFTGTINGTVALLDSRYGWQLLVIFICTVLTA